MLLYKSFILSVTFNDKMMTQSCLPYLLGHFPPRCPVRWGGADTAQGTGPGSRSTAAGPPKCSAGCEGGPRWRPASCTLGSTRWLCPQSPGSRSETHNTRRHMAVIWLFVVSVDFSVSLSSDAKKKNYPALNLHVRIIVSICVFITLQNVCVQGSVTGSMNISRHTGQRQSSRDNASPVLCPLPLFDTILVVLSYIQPSENTKTFQVRNWNQGHSWQGQFSPGRKKKYLWIKSDWAQYTTSAAVFQINWREVTQSCHTSVQIQNCLLFDNEVVCHVQDSFRT